MMKSYMQRKMDLINQQLNEIYTENMALNKDLAKAMGVDTVGMTEAEGVRAAVDAVRKLSLSIGIPQKLHEINVKEAGATAFYAMGEGGFLSALWKMAEASQVGLEMDFSKVPIRQETIEICEIFDINPYKLNSEGAVLIGIPAGEALVQELRRMGMMAAVIGQTNAGNDRMLYYNGNGRYLERPAKDEIYKILP